jgi:ABC-type multidrug transport system ATPase subunit
MKKPFLQINQVTKTYFEGRRAFKKALQGVSLDLYQGEVLGLLGVNGAGKTTLVSILATLHPPTSGEILWNGTSIYDVLLPFRSVVGYCPQHPNIEDDSLYDRGEFIIGDIHCLRIRKNSAANVRL